MVKRFKKGKSYRFVGTERPVTWNEEGAMDFLLDGKPHRVSRVDDPKGRVAFEDDGEIWSFLSTIHLFEEVKEGLFKRLLHKLLG